MSLENGIYIGHVYHKRHAPFEHEFRYKVFTLLLDIDTLEHTSKSLKFFSYNRWNIFSLFNKDHGARDGSHMRPWIERAAKDKNIDITGGKIFMLAFPRLWGFVFNPISLYYCYDKAGALACILYQVKNTFGEQHGYLLGVQKDDSGAIKQSCEKIFHVSPFIEMDCVYNFIVREPNETLDFTIDQRNIDTHGERHKMLTATWNGKRYDLTDRNIIRTMLMHPFMTFKVVIGIHWEAFWLWIKGAKYIKRPPPPKSDVS